MKTFDYSLVRDPQYFCDNRMEAHSDHIYYKNAEEMQQQLIPNVEIFKEIMVELIRNKEINMEVLKKERSEFIQDQTADFQLNEMLLQLSEERFSDKKIGKIEVYRIEDGSTVTFDNVFSENGVKKSIRCSNILIRIMRNEE